MTLPSQNNRLLIAGLLAVAVATIVIAALVLRSDDDDSGPAASKSDHFAPPLDAWNPSEESPALRVAVDSSAGPILQLDDQTRVVLTPEVQSPAGFHVDWRDWQVRRSADKTSVVGSGTAGKAGVEATWTFFEGNPQVHLRLTLTEVPAARLADDIILATSFPNGEAGGVAPLTPMPTGVAGPAHWEGDGHTLAYSNFTGQGISSADGSRLEFVLWQRKGSRKDIDWSDCAEAPEGANGAKELTVDLSADLTVTVDSEPAVSRWPLAAGHEAALAPVFDVPAEHPDAQLAQGAAKDADRWLWRARTLLYGHSAPEDPRYGNGGLLGHGLGGTLVVPSAFAGDEAVEELAAKLEGTRAELAPRSATAKGYADNSRLASSASCAKLLELARAGIPAVITGTPQTGKLTDVVVDPGPHGLPATPAPVQLDGRRHLLLTNGLAPDILEPLVARRKIASFATPFVATRNPLIGAFKEALLEPERDGHWTVAADVASALADLELFREATPLLVTSLADIARHTGHARQVMWWWNEDGALVVHNPKERALRGATFLVRGTASAKLGESQTATSRVLSLDDGRAVTLLWWDIEPGTHTVALSREGSALPRPAPVSWEIPEK